MLTPKENLLRLLRGGSPDHLPYAGEGCFCLVDHRGRMPPREGRDEWGVVWAPLPPGYRAGAGEPAESYPVAHPARSVAELATWAFPDGSDPALFAGLLEGLQQSRAHSLIIGQHSAGPLDRLALLLGMLQALTALITDVEAAEAVLQRLAAYHIDIARGYLAAGVEAAWLADDYAGQDGPYLRPTVWRRVVLPALTRIIDVYASRGVPVFFHTCGASEPFVGDLLDAGVTVFNLQSSACDLPALKARYGRRIAFFGGVANQLMQTGGPDDVRQAACAAIAALGHNGRLILAADQPLAYPPENEAALVEVARTYGGRLPVARFSTEG